MKQKSLLFALLFASASCFAQPKAGNMQKLVQGDAGFMCPTWSPDSKKVAITGDNFKGIWIAEINGSGLAQITAEAGAGYKMAWNATGEKILARTNIYRNQRVFHELKTFDIKTKKAETLVPESRGLSVASWRTAEKIMLHKGKRPVALSKKGAMENAELSVYETMVADPFHALLQIPELKELADKPVINPVMSPDKTKVAFQIPGKGVYTCDSNGSNVNYLGKGAYPSWTPDNKYVIVAKVTDNGATFTSSELLAVDATTAESTVFFRNSNMIPMTPAVSPDGKKLAFENCVDGCIYTIDIIY